MTIDRWTYSITDGNGIVHWYNYLTGIEIEEPRGALSNEDSLPPGYVSMLQDAGAAPPVLTASSVSPLAVTANEHRNIIIVAVLVLGYLMLRG